MPTSSKSLITIIVLITIGAFVYGGFVYLDGRGREAGGGEERVSVNEKVVEDNTTNAVNSTTESTDTTDATDAITANNDTDSDPGYVALEDITMDTSKWVTYRNEELGVEVKLPGELYINDKTISSDTNVNLNPLKKDRLMIQINDSAENFFKEGDLKKMSSNILRFTELEELTVGDYPTTITKNSLPIDYKKTAFNIEECESFCNEVHYNFLISGKIITISMFDSFNKGELERELKKIPFSIKSQDITYGDVSKQVNNEINIQFKYPNEWGNIIYEKSHDFSSDGKDHSIYSFNFNNNETTWIHIYGKNFLNEGEPLIIADDLYNINNNLGIKNYCNGIQALLQSEEEKRIEDNSLSGLSYHDLAASKVRFGCRQMQINGRDAVTFFTWYKTLDGQSILDFYKYTYIDIESDVHTPVVIATMIPKVNERKWVTVPHYPDGGFYEGVSVDDSGLIEDIEESLVGRKNLDHEVETAIKEHEDLVQSIAVK